jgi:hypothetical protein
MKRKNNKSKFMVSKLKEIAQKEMSGDEEKKLNCSHKLLYYALNFFQNNKLRICVFFLKDL